MGFKKGLSIFGVFSSLIGSLVSQYSFASATVAGCDHVGTYCDVYHKLSSISNVFAPKVKVWTSDESQASVDALKARMDRRFTEQTNARTQSVDSLNGSVQAVRNELGGRIDRAIQHTDRVRDEIRNSLRDELQRLLRAQTCEDRLISNVGTAGRSAQVTAKIECIKTALNKWRGVNAQGQPIVVADGNALSREQVSQMLRSLEVLIGDPDTTALQRQYISDTMNLFSIFNLLE